MFANAPQVTLEEAAQSEAWIRSADFRKAVAESGDYQPTPEELIAAAKIPGGYHFALAQKLAAKHGGNFFIHQSTGARH